MAQGRRKHSLGLQGQGGPGCGEGGGDSGPTGGPVRSPTWARFKPGRRSCTGGAAGVFGNGQDQKAKSDAALDYRPVATRRSAS